MQASPVPDPLTPLTATGHLCIWNSVCADTLKFALALQLKAQLDEKAEEVKQANDDLIEKVIMRPCAVTCCLCPSRYLLMVPGNVGALHAPPCRS